MEIGPVLYIIHPGQGGTFHTSIDLIGSVSKSTRCFLLTTGYTSWTLEYFYRGSQRLLSQRRFTNLWMVSYRPDPKRESAIREIISHLGIRLVHLRHFIGNYPEWINLFKNLRLPVVVSLHDFYPICPTINLIDNSGRFCGGDCRQHPVPQKFPSDPEFSSKSGRDCLAAYLPEAITLKDKYVHAWRSRFQEAFDAADVLVTTSDYVRETFVRHFPSTEKEQFRIIPHGRDFYRSDSAAKAPIPGKPIRLLSLGGFAPHKGGRILVKLIRENHQNQGPFEIHVIGESCPPALNEFERVYFHGSYSRDDIHDRLMQIQPSFGLILSIWPETWCHVLTEAWNAAIPCIAFEGGVFSERFPSDMQELLLPMESAHNPFPTLVKICSTFRWKEVAPGSWINPSCSEMAEEYEKIYLEILNPAGRAGSQFVERSSVEKG